MKTRLIYTKFWNDDYVQNELIEQYQKYFYLWILTNQYIDVLNIIDASDSVIANETGMINRTQIQKAKEKLQQDGKIDYFSHYIFVRNAYKYQTFAGVKNANPKLRIIYEMSDEAILHFMPRIEQWLAEIKNDIEPYKLQEPYFKIKRLQEKVAARVKMIKEQNTPMHTPIDTPIVDVVVVPVVEAVEIIPAIPLDTSALDTPMHTPSDRVQNTEIRNKNSENKNQNTEIENKTVTEEETVAEEEDPIAFIRKKYGTITKTAKTHADALKIYSGKKRTFKRPRHEPIFAEDAE